MAEKGRPKAAEEKSVQINLRFTETEKEAIDQAAENDERTVSAWARLVIIRELRNLQLI